MADKEILEWQNQDPEDYQCYLDFQKEWFEVTEEANEL